MRRLSVSLVMPNFNHEAFLERSLGALLRQDYAPAEIILIDDASTDGSIACIERLIAGRTDVRLVRNQQRCGAVAALNQGLAMATGDLVAFPSADDQIFPQFLDTLERLLRTNETAAFACAVTEIRDEHDHLLGHRPVLWPTLSPRFVPPDLARSQLLHGDNFYLGPVTLYRRGPLQAAGGFDVAMASLSDGMLQRRLALRYGFCFTPGTLGIWRHHTSNYSISSITDPLYLRQLLAIATDFIEKEATEPFPHEYAINFARRLSFNAARLVMISGMSAVEKAERVAGMLGLPQHVEQRLAMLCSVGPAGDTLVLAWLALRQRPYSLSWLCIEPARRVVARILALLLPG